MHLSRQSFHAAFAALAVLSASGCAVVQERTLGESFDDTSTGAQIETLLLSKGVARFGEVDVQTSDRLVLLAGRVPSDADRVEAERVAWSVDGVDEVANELFVTDRNLGRDLNDNWIAARVRARLVGDGSVKSVNYNVHVFNGVVYLLGFAQSQEELRRAAEHAAVVKGVEKVVSYVKMRERDMPSNLAGAPPQPAPAYTAPATETQAPAPLYTQTATQRGAYSDPYASNAPAPPPAAYQPPPEVTAGELPPASAGSVSGADSGGGADTGPIDLTPNEFD